MNALIQLTRTIFVFLVAGLCYGLLPTAQAVSPDGCLPGGNTAEGCNALLSLTTGTFNTAVGFDSLLSNTDANFNTGVGAGTLLLNTAGENTATGAGAFLSNTNGSQNTADGAFALFSNDTGVGNTAVGNRALFSNTVGADNVAVGYLALSSLAKPVAGNVDNNVAIGAGALATMTDGSFNIAIGFNAGVNLTSGGQNIYIGNDGFPNEIFTIRIGVPQSATYIAGINGQTASGGAAVYVNSDGKLGTSPSSVRFKDHIKSMDKASEAILALKPVTFSYKKEFDPKGIPQFGLLAEDVEKINPDLVARDSDGKPYTVRYDAVNAMLLNEFLKEHAAFLTEQRKVEQLEKQVAALTVGLQKVSAQLEASRSVPQVVDSN
jgi:hypothetical protein